MLPRLRNHYARMTNKEQFIRGLRQAWRDEVRSAKNYRALAERESNPDKKSILVRMAEAEERHAETWAKRLRELGVEPGEYVETLQERARRWVLLRSDTVAAAKMLEAGEQEADSLYESLLANAQSEEDRAILLETQREEQAHNRMLEEFEGPLPHPQSKLEKILGREQWHVRAGGWIGQAIYGVNDGLGAAFGVVSGVAGATHVNGEFVLLSGFATMIASALSMGSGAYLATKSEREVYEAELNRERKEIEENPAEEREELELFYQLKGFSEQEAKAMVARLADNPDQLLKTLAHEELGLSEQSFPKVWRSAVSATLSTAVGALIPVLPFLFSHGTTALLTSLVVSTVAHFAVGASKVIVTGRSWVKSGLEMTLVGIGEAAITYCIGLLISPVVS
ncbi:MAG TPA: VIT1/CCC1 transporter family protein [Bacteroidota bacterium]|nr:VIT1/CCC1 transporter family protein [Bacteroidota bacterium]